jgi:hypothetical protein
MSLLFLGRNRRSSDGMWASRSGYSVATDRRIRVEDKQTSTYSQIYQSGDDMHVEAKEVILGDPIGHTTRKDMRADYADDLSAEYAPGNVAIAGETHMASYWRDWGNDIFDSWGFFYIFDVESETYFFPVFQTINQDDGVLATETFEAFDRTFQITHGYIARGIYKFDVSATTGPAFIFGAYGDMGSDEDTENVNLTHPYTRDGRALTLYYNRNIETGDRIERFFSYFVPYDLDLNTTTKTYQDFHHDEDKLSIFSVPVTTGITVYFSKKADVKKRVIDDLVNGARQDALTVNGDTTIAGGIDASALMVDGHHIIFPGIIVFRASGESEGVPDGWLLCDGGEHSISSYPRLAATLGFSWTPDDEENPNTFTVPNLMEGGPPQANVMIIIKT